MRLQGKITLITGGAQGIGRAIADRFAQEGSHIALCDVNEAGALAAAEEIAARFKVQTLARKTDVTQSADCDALVKAVLDKFGKIDVLVNNAGITRDNLIIRMSDEEWDRVLSVNLKGAFVVTKAAARPMLKARSGRIINICSVVGLMGNAGQANYAASKGGLISLTKTCAREFASRNLLVNAIAPGFIKTAMTDKLSEEQKTALAALIPLERLGLPEDIAGAALFLAGEESSYITGHVLSVNGGMYM